MVIPLAYFGTTTLRKLTDIKLTVPAALRPVLSRVLPQAVFTVAPDSGHLLPLEAPDTAAAACMRVVTAVG